MKYKMRIIAQALSCPANVRSKAWLPNNKNLKIREHTTKDNKCYIF